MLIKKALRFGKDGSFHILMISDFHGGPHYNRQLKTGIHALLQETRPDLVLLNGDISVGDMYDNGVCTADGLRAYLSDVLEELEQNKIPWAHVFGNHDRESGMDLIEQQKVYESFPCCLSYRGLEELHGVGNYVLPVQSSDGSRIAYNIWGLDSLRGYYDYQEAFCMPDCNFILPENFGGGSVDVSPMFDQVMWYYTTSQQMERENGSRIPAIMYLHVGILEMQLMRKNWWECRVTGERRQTIDCGEMNSGLFMACKLRGDVEGIFFGHEHLCDFCGNLFGITMAYDSALGYNMSAHDDLRGGREIILHEDGSPLATRHIKLVALMGDAAIRRK
jgi:hypothetical protein